VTGNAELNLTGEKKGGTSQRTRAGSDDINPESPKKSGKRRHEIENKGRQKETCETHPQENEICAPRSAKKTGPIQRGKGEKKADVLVLPSERESLCELRLKYRGDKAWADSSTRVVISYAVVYHRARAGKLDGGTPAALTKRQLYNFLKGEKTPPALKQRKEGGKRYVKEKRGGRALIVARSRTLRCVWKRVAAPVGSTEEKIKGR